MYLHRRIQIRNHLRCSLAIGFACALANLSAAQRIPLGTPTAPPVQPMTGPAQPPITPYSNVTYGQQVPGQQIPGQPMPGQPAVQFGAPVTGPPGMGDPFQVTNQLPTQGAAVFNDLSTGTTMQASPFTAPAAQSFPPGSVVYPPMTSDPVYGPGPVPAGGPPVGFQQPTSGDFGTSTPQSWPSQSWARLQTVQWHRLFERPRFRHTFIGGDGGDANKPNQLQINDSELATTINIPNFVWCGLPLRVSPGFVLHLWSGPNLASGYDLPARAYSAYLAFDYLTRIDRKLGAELNFTIGVYSDFNHTTSDSLRFTGVGLGWWRMTNYTTAKLGVEYIDRLDIKLLPAFGVFITPRNDVRFDLYFPRPRISKRIPNWGCWEVWMYAGAEYGGGNWTLRRLAAPDTVISDRVDINDIRIFGGLEWLGPRNVTGFAELGYVFNRELVFIDDPMGPDPDPMSRLKLLDSIMVRAGISF